MKKLVCFMILALVSLSFATRQTAIPASSTIVSPQYSVVHAPADVQVITLCNAAVSAGDTIGVDSCNWYGPFPLSDVKGEPSYKGFEVYAGNGVVSSGDSIEISYQLVSGGLLSDTVSSWTVIDTVATGGKALAYVDLSSKSGKAIVIRIQNIDSTDLTLQKAVRVVFKRPETWQK